MTIAHNSKIGEIIAKKHTFRRKSCPFSQLMSKNTPILFSWTNANKKSLSSSAIMELFNNFILLICSSRSAIKNRNVQDVLLF